MKAFFRFAAALSLSFLAVEGTAYACSCEAQCVKTASPTEIGPIYPATISYEVKFSCVEYDPKGQLCGCVNEISDSLVADAFASSPTSTGGNLCFPQKFEYWPIAEFEYSIGVTWEQCKAWGTPNGDGTYTLKNIVDASGATAGLSPDLSCEASVVCKPPPPPDDGCTATPGYWKTHASGRKYNATWESVGGPGAAFFLSGQTYLEVISSPTETMKYYILARQYIAAVLNGFAGASVPTDVQAALAFAESFFATYTPTSQLTKELETQLVMNAALLDGYNNGLEGPPHCD
jgi:hypothetical protein